MKDNNFFSAFEKQLETHAQKTFLITDLDQIFRYQDIANQSARFANYLTSLGLVAGDRVSMQVEKSPQALCLYLACLRAGLVCHPLNPAYTPAELEYFLGNAAPVVLVCDEGTQDLLLPIASAAGIQSVCTLNADGSGSLIDFSRDESSIFNSIARDPDDLAALLYSSGTTGVPKGIMLTHSNLLSNAATLVEAWGFSENDHLLHALPIFHVHGLFVALGCVILSGASMRWLPSFNSQSVIRFLPDSTCLMGVPTYYTRLLDDEKFTEEVCQNVRLFVSGSAPLLTETFDAFEELTGHRILERYGMTETNMNTSNPLEGERKAGTVGPPLPGVEVRITDEQNHVLDRGEIGNLQVKGPNVFKGYWKLPEKTNEDFTPEGFFNTSDKGTIDQDGYVSIVGRSKDVVNCGGLNVYPKEVELVLDQLDGVKESAVIGVPHSDFGEAVVAILVLDAVQDEALNAVLDEATVIAYAKQHLANFKVPKRVMFATALPRNTMGKVQKNGLRETNSTLFEK